MTTTNPLVSLPDEHPIINMGAKITTTNHESFRVISPGVAYGGGSIQANYKYQSTKIEGSNVYPIEENYVFKTSTQVPRLGVMLVGLGGNNGTTVTGGIIANRLKLEWETKERRHIAD